MNASAFTLMALYPVMELVRELYLTHSSLFMFIFIFSIYASFGENKISFDKKIETISTALRQLRYRLSKFWKVVFLVDLKSAV